MLLSLHIENYALISTLHVQFDKGMTVITGETGAGKSIIMGALSLILGNRADLGVLFDKSKKCSVEAVFDIKDLELFSFFEQNDLDYQDNTIVRREITESGKSRAFINDTPVNLPILKELASRLIDIHSQHHNLLFQNADFRIAVLDEFARTQTEATSYRTLLKELKQKEAELSQKLEIQRNRLEKRDFMQFVYNELSSANLQADEQEQLEQEIDFLSHSETIKDNCYRISTLFSEKEGNVLDSLREIKSLCSSISSYHPDIKCLNERLENSFIDLKDISDEVLSLNDKVEYDPELLERKRQRLDLLNTLEQKHHVTSVEALLEKRNVVQQELEALSEDEQNLETLKADCDRLRTDALARAKALSQKRSAAVSALQKEILQKVKQLGMPDAQFAIQVTPLDSLQKMALTKCSIFFQRTREWRWLNWKRWRPAVKCHD